VGAVYGPEKQADPITRPTMTDETDDDALPTPGAVVRLLLGVAVRLVALYLLAMFVLLVPVVLYCATR
jgi:hypothetical protein